MVGVRVVRQVVCLPFRLPRGFIEEVLVTVIVVVPTEEVAVGATVCAAYFDVAVTFAVGSGVGVCLRGGRPLGLAGDRVVQVILALCASNGALERILAGEK